MAATAKSEQEQTEYRAGGGRRIAFTFIFLLLLPFYVSLPAMLYQRIVSGLWVDTAGLIVIAIAFTILMALVVAEMLSSIRTHVSVGDKSVRLTVPSTSGPTPKFTYKSHEVLYDHIDSVETRREIYGGTLAPVKLLGSRLMLKDGGIVPLGFVSEADTDPAIPYPDIAKQIAARSGKPLHDRGSVFRTMRQRLLRIKAKAAQDREITQAEIDTLNSQHRNLVLALISFLVLLVGTGILLDFLGPR